MTYEELLEENKRLKELVDRQTDTLAMNCAKLIIEEVVIKGVRYKKVTETKTNWKKIS
jgi:hypothetical protein